MLEIQYDVVSDDCFDASVVPEFFVTGCSGFIGTHLVKRLLDMGYMVTGYDLAEPIYSHSNFEFIEGDILDAEKLRACIVAPDCVYHLAAQTTVPGSTRDSSYDFEVNARGTFNVLSCAKSTKFIYASTSTVYGIAPHPTPETHRLKPISFYGASKAAGELYCHAFFSTFGTPTVMLRLYNVYGPGNAKGVMHDLIRKLERNREMLEILGTGLQEKDYVYIDDAINAFLIAHERGAPGEEYNVGSGMAVTVNEIATLLFDMMNLDPQVCYTGGKSWQGDVESTLADISKIRSLGWDPVTELKTGIQSLLEWMECQF